MNEIEKFDVKELQVHDITRIGDLTTLVEVDQENSQVDHVATPASKEPQRMNTISQLAKELYLEANGTP